SFETAILADELLHLPGKPAGVDQEAVHFGLGNSLQSVVPLTPRSTMHKKNSHCSYCGQAFVENQPYPRKSPQSTNITYVNPLPVAVCLLPVDGGLLCIRRDIEPGKGKLALPGGFIDLGETWQQAAARELFEETGIRIDAGEIQEFRVISSQLGDNI